MRWMSFVVLAALLGCAGPASRDDDAQARRDAKRELAQECRIAAVERRHDPDCPQSEPDRSMGPERVPLPAPPVSVPGR
jgi:hypothetical protein